MGISTSDIVLCRDYHSLPNITDICQFVNVTEDCQIDEGFINYLSFIFCYFTPSTYPLAIVITVVWWLILFMTLAITAESFFCPNLATLADLMHCSDSLAGVTFVAFGNGAPDIFSAISAVSAGSGDKMGLAFGALLGAGIFVTTVVVGAIAVAHPFKAMERPLLKDIIFYLAAVFWTFCILYRGRIYLIESVGFLVMYGVYVIVTLIGRAVYKSKKSSHLGHVPAINVLPDDMEGVLHSDHNERSPLLRSRPTSLIVPQDGALDHHSIASNSGSFVHPNYMAKWAAAHDFEEYSDEEEDYFAPRESDGTSSVHNVLDDPYRGMANLASPTLPSSDDADNVPFIGDDHPRSGWQQLLRRISPIDKAEFVQMNCLGKAYEIIKAPILLLLGLLIPVVDSTQPNGLWVKYLCIVQCVTCTTFCGMVTKVGLYQLGGVFPVWALILLFGLGLGLLVALTSSVSTPPRYHRVFALLGFLTSIVGIYSVANEIVNILTALGTFFDVSQAVLGLTLLALGNSIGDLFSDYALAKEGRPRMAVSACFGGPLFNLMLGIGIPFTIQTIRNGGSFEIQRTTVDFVLIGFLCASLVSSLVILPATGFKLNRIFGAFLFIFYAVFLAVALLAEFGVIP